MRIYFLISYHIDLKELVIATNHSKLAAFTNEKSSIWLTLLLFLRENSFDFALPKGGNEKRRYKRLSL